MSQHIGRSCRVYWKNDGEWFHGVIDDYHVEQGWHCQYYDGDDEWLPKLDPAVILFDDNDKAAGQSLGSTGGRSRIEEKEEKDEVVVVSAGREQEPEVIGGSEDKDVQDEHHDGDDGEGEEEDFRSGAFDLPERGVLLLGVVTGASNLPETAADCGGEVFFRVLYVEGGPASTMFRCKTPIFTSAATQDVSFPTWQEGSFRFEMVAPAAVPDEVSAVKGRPSTTGSTGGKSYLQPRLASIKESYASEQASSSSFKLTGEVLIVLYRQRPSGGSDYIGQVAFDLQEIARAGAPEVHMEGIEARSVKGSFPLVARNGASEAGMDLAHVDLSLELAWRSEVEPLLASPTRGLSGASLAPSRTGSAHSAVAGKKRAGAALSTSSKLGSIASSQHTRGPTPSSVAGSKAPAKTAGPLPSKPKAASSSTSNASRRNRTEQMRIERENKALQNRLLAQKSKNPTNHKSIQKADDVYAIDAAPKKSADEEAGVDPKFARMVRSMGAPELVQMFYAMKKDVAAREKRVKDCRATNSRLKLQTVKYGSAIERLKKTMASAPSPSAAAAADAGGAKSGSGGGPSVASSGSKVADSKAPVGCTSHAEEKSSSGAPRDGGAMEEAPDADEDDADSLDEVRDKELKELLHEHRALQEVRRGLVDRILAVKRITRESTEIINDAIKREEVARIRIEGISRKAGGGGGGGDAGSSVSDELLAIDRLRGVAIELARTVAAREAGVHLGPLTDSLCELQAVHNTLQAHLEVVSKEVDTCRYERDVHYERFSQLTDGSVARRVRSGINILRTILTRLRTKQRVAKYENGSDAVELEVLRLRLRQQQLKASVEAVGWE